MSNSKALPTEVAVEELPKSIVRRVVKDKLSQSTEDGGDINLHKDALTAFTESARIFIHYLSATANDICRESKRQTINADDVLKALEEIEFPEFVGPLKASLDDFRQKNASKKEASAKSKEENNKKRKVDDQPSEHTEKEDEPSEPIEKEDDSGENVIELPNEEENAVAVPDE